MRNDIDAGGGSKSRLPRISSRASPTAARAVIGPGSNARFEPDGSATRVHAVVPSDPGGGTALATVTLPLLATGRVTLEDPRSPVSLSFALGGARDAQVACGVRVTWNGVEYPAVVDSAWTSTGTMTDTRMAHTATLLGSGRVLVAGGMSKYAPYFNSDVELYDPGTGTFAATGSMAVERSDHTATLLSSGKVLIAGGDNHNTNLAEAELYDPSTGTFKSTSSMTTARYLHTATPTEPYPMSIASKFTLALLTGIALAVMGYATLAVRGELARSESDVVEHESATAHALRPAIRDVWTHDGERRALELIDEARARLRNVDLRLVSLAPDAAVEKRPRVPARALAALAVGQDVVVVDHDFERTGRIFTYVPVTFASAEAIEVSQSLAGHAAVRREVLRRAGLTALVIAAASGIVTSLLGLILVGRPLAELVVQARRIGEGDLSYRITTGRRDEIAALGQEMNRMCERLRVARENERAQADAKTHALSQLRHADRLATVGRLAAGLAHELGTPLNVVQARARQMTGDPLGPAEVADKARIIVEQVARMTKLIRQLLDFARKGDLSPADIDVRALLEHATSLLEPIARKRGVTLRVNGGAESARGRLDPEQMTQVVLNLVMNAVQATEPGKAVSVAVGRDRALPPAADGRSEQPCLRIDVRDEGHGISPEALPQIFEPFYTTKDVGDGTGLGLSVAYGIVADHGGWIDVVSRPGEGSTFTVWLPEAGRA